MTSKGDGSQGDERGESVGGGRMLLFVQSKDQITPTLKTVIMELSSLSVRPFLIAMVNVGGLIFQVMVDVTVWVGGINTAGLFKSENVCKTHGQCSLSLSIGLVVVLPCLVSPCSSSCWVVTNLEVLGCIVSEGLRLAAT